MSYRCLSVLRDQRTTHRRTFARGNWPTSLKLASSRDACERGYAAHRAAAKGFQQTEAAARLGVDQSLLSRMENGFLEPRDEVLIRAEADDEFPRSFFFLTDPVYGAPVSVHPMWRRKTDVTVREMDLSSPN